MNLIELNLYQTCICDQYYNAQYYQDTHHTSKSNQNSYHWSLRQKRFVRNGNIIKKKRKTRWLFSLDAKDAMYHDSSPSGGRHNN